MNDNERNAQWAIDRQKKAAERISSPSTHWIVQAMDEHIAKLVALKREGKSS